MAEKMTIAMMQQLISRLEQAKAEAVDSAIPHVYRSLLEQAAKLNAEIKKIPQVDWESIESADQIERAEEVVAIHADFKRQIEKFFIGAANSVSNTSGMKIGGGKKRRMRRSSEEVAHEAQLKEIRMAAKEALGLPTRGRLNEDQQQVLDKEIAKQMKKQKIAVPVE